MEGYRVEFTGTGYIVGCKEEMGKDSTELKWRKTEDEAQDLVDSLNKSFVVALDEESDKHSMQICNCVDCQSNFVLTKSNFDYFKKNNLMLPKRCPACRLARKEAQNK